MTGEKRSTSDNTGALIVISLARLIQLARQSLVARQLLHARSSVSLQIMESESWLRWIWLLPVYSPLGPSVTPILAPYSHLPILSTVASLVACNVLWYFSISQNWGLQKSVKMLSLRCKKRNDFIIPRLLQQHMPISSSSEIIDLRNADNWFMKANTIKMVNKETDRERMLEKVYPKLHQKSALLWSQLNFCRTWHTWKKSVGVRQYGPRLQVFSKKTYVQVRTFQASIWSLERAQALF